jgi:hypothetical protein
MCLQQEIRFVMTRRGIGRAELAQLLGYKNIAKGLRRLDAWTAGSERPGNSQRELLAEFLALSVEQLDALLAKDQKLLFDERRRKRAQDPHYYLTLRLMAAVYSTKRLPAGIARRKAIRTARELAIASRKKCALNTPKNQTLWFNEKGEVYAISEEGPTMRIGGHKVSLNLY